MSIITDKSGDIWIGTKTGGVSCLNNASFISITTAQGLPYNEVEAIYEDKSGTLWIGLFGGGAIKFDGNLFHHYSLNQGLSNQHVMSIIEDNNGIIWFATWGGGISLFDGKLFYHFNTENGLKDNYIRHLYKDNKGHVWIGTYNGVASYYDGENIYHYTLKKGSVGNSVMSILEDSSGNMWFGTRGTGIFRFDGKTFTNYTTDNGISDNFVTGIIEDNDNNIWFSTKNGLTYYDIHSQSIINGIYLFKVFDHNNGLKGMNFLHNSVFQDNQNKLWWGNEKALIVLDLDKFELSDKPPKIQLDRISINEDQNNFGSVKGEGVKFKGLSRFSQLPQELELSHENNHLTFYYSGNDWQAPQQLKYQFRLNGLDDDWRSTTKEIYANYWNLNHGTYQFAVRAAGISNIWSDSIEYSFVIHPPWWLTWWARLCYIIVAILVVVAIVKLRTSTLKKQKKVLEMTVQNRTEEIVQQNEEISTQRDEIKAAYHQLEESQHQLVQSEKMASLGQLTAGIAHEINNPINYVITAIESLNLNLQDLFKIIDFVENMEGGNLSKGHADLKTLKDNLSYKVLVKELSEQPKHIINGINRTAEIIKDLQSFSRLGGKNKEFSDIHDGLNSTLNILDHKVSDQITVIKEYGDIPEILCYPARLNQVFMNILHNAIDAIKSKNNSETVIDGEIIKDQITIGTKILTSEEKSYVSISIRDTGPGIDDDIKAKIFDPFFTTKKAGEGTGLGLSISSKIIDEHDGTIKLEDNSQAGACFVIMLPNRANS